MKKISWKEFKDNLVKLQKPVLDRDGDVWCKYMYCPPFGCPTHVLNGTLFKNLAEAKEFWREYAF